MDIERTRITIIVCLIIIVFLGCKWYYRDSLNAQYSDKIVEEYIEKQRIIRLKENAMREEKNAMRAEQRQIFNVEVSKRTVNESDGPEEYLEITKNLIRATDLAREMESIDNNEWSKLSQAQKKDFIKKKVDKVYSQNKNYYRKGK